MLLHFPSLHLVKERRISSFKLAFTSLLSSKEGKTSDHLFLLQGKVGRGRGELVLCSPFIILKVKTVHC